MFLKLSLRSPKNQFISQPTNKILFWKPNFFSYHEPWGPPLWIWPFIPIINNFFGTFQELCDLFDSEKDIRRKEAALLWEEIAREECLEYFEYQRANVGLDKEIGDKTTGYFTDLLKDFSTAQIYNHIWNALKSALYMKEKNKMGRAHTANLVANLCKSRGERAKAENWDVKPYRRDFECPESIISQLFFFDVTGIGEGGFNKKPGNWN